MCWGAPERGWEKKRGQQEGSLKGRAGRGVFGRQEVVVFCASDADRFIFILSARPTKCQSDSPYLDKVCKVARTQTESDH